MSTPKSKKIRFFPSRRLLPSWQRTFSERRTWQSERAKWRGNEPLFTYRTAQLWTTLYCCNKIWATIIFQVSPISGQHSRLPNRRRRSASQPRAKSDKLWIFATVVPVSPSSGRSFSAGEVFRKNYTQVLCIFQQCQFAKVSKLNSILVKNKKTN